MDTIIRTAVCLLVLLAVGVCHGEEAKTMNLTTKNGKPFAAVIDIFPQICLSRHDSARVEREIALLAGLGVKRLYFVVCLPGYPSFSNPWLAPLPADNYADNHALASIEALGSPNEACCRMAKQYGLEAYAILKPYEGGGGSTVPHGARLGTETGGRRPCVGGDRIYFDTLLAAHPELAVARRPIPNYARDVAQPIQRVELAFCLDEVRGAGRAPSFPAAPADYRCEDYPLTVMLWGSEDNGRYEQVDADYTVREKIVSREIRDSNGFPVFDEPKRCRVVELDGLNLPSSVRYVAVTLDTDPAHLRMLKAIPASMFQIHGPDAPIPSSTALHARHGVSPSQAALPPEQRTWGQEGHPRQNSMDFTTWGFEFDWHGGDIWFGNGWHANRVYGLGRGKIMTMKGTHCEAYPEVRGYWLGQVADLIEMGYDGVDIRLQNHSGMVSDFAAFGYNPPLVARYRETYGVDPLEDGADPLKMMAVRGTFFMEFLRDAADLLHQRGRKLQVHLRHAHQSPRVLPDFNELGFWAMPKIWIEDWRGAIDLADEVTIKDYYWGKYRPDDAREIKAYAHAQGKPVWIHNYIGQGDAIKSEFIDAVAADPHVSGILLYEAFHAGAESNEPNQGLIGVGGAAPAYHEAAVAALRAVSKSGPATR